MSSWIQFDEVMWSRSRERLWDGGWGLRRDALVVVVAVQRNVRQGHVWASALLPQQGRHGTLSATDRGDADVCRRRARLRGRATPSPVIRYVEKVTTICYDKFRKLTYEDLRDITLLLQLTVSELWWIRGKIIRTVLCRVCVEWDKCHLRSNFCILTVKFW